MIQTDEKPLNLRLFTCVTAAAVLLAGAYYLNLEQLYYMAGMLGGVPLAAYLFSRIPLGRLRVERRAPRRLNEGETFEVSLAVSHPGRTPRAGLWLEDALGRWLEPRSRPAFLVPLVRRAPTTLTYEAMAAKRGEHAVGPLLVSARDPVGLFEQRREVGDSAQVLVYPQILPIAARETTGARSFSGTDAGRAAIGGDGIDFYGVRDYRPGDELRRIDWKATARVGSLTVTEFDQSMAGDLVVALDLAQGSDVGEGRDSTLEYGARLAASLANYALRNSAAFTLLASADGEPKPVSAAGLTDLDRVLEVLARAQAVAPVSLSSVLAKADLRLPPDGTLVLITTASDPGLVALAGDWLARRLRVVAFLLDPSTFDSGGAARSRELPGFLAALTSLGVAGLLVRRGDDLATVLNRAVAGVPQHAWSSEAPQ
jgi:uncharacterized protein (DUF58 family)